MSTSTPHEETSPRRVLGPIRGLGLSLGVVVGAGIFVAPAWIAQQLPDPRLFLLIWLAGGLVSLCTALAYAELATAFPRTGGYVVYLREVYGDRVAFVYGWAAMLVLYPASIAGVARAFGRAVGELVEGAPVGPLAVALVLAATMLNLRGVDLSSRAQVGLSALKVTALLALAALGVAGVGAAPAAPEAPAGAVGMGAALLALIGVLWSFEGFLEVVVVAGEVRRPGRTIVRVLVGSVLGITAVYLLYALALLRHLGIEGIAASPAVAAELARRIAGEPGGAGVAAVIAVATASAVLSLLFSGPRILVALAEAGLFFPAAGRVSGRGGSPRAAVAIAGAAAAIYAAFGSFEELMQYFFFATGLFSALILSGGLWLRARGRIAREDRRIPLWPLPPLLAVLTALGGAAVVVHNQPRSSLLGLLILLLALPLSGRFGGKRLER